MTVYTAGHSNRSIGDLIALLEEAGVHALVDVRAFPRSRRWPQFNRDALAGSLAARAIGYAWRGEALGGFRKPAADSPHVALSDAFRGFADHMATAAFAQAIAALLAEAARAPTAVMCAERLPADCHRSLIADALIARGASVVHLIEPGKREPARLSPAARVDRGCLVYDGELQRRLL